MSSPNNNNSLPRTKDDKQVAAALTIRGVSSNLKELSKCLDNAIEMLKNPNDFSNAKRGVAALKALKDHLIGCSGHLSQNVNSGFQPLSPDSLTPSDTTVRNYQSLIAAQPNVSIARTVLVKSTTRFTAENSLRSAMSFILTTAASHFVLSATTNHDVMKDVKDKAALSEASKFLFDQVSKGHNDRAIEPVRRAYILSTDDTTEFVFSGRGTNISKAEFKLVSSQSLATAGTRSKFETGSGEAMNGLRVKLTHTFAANGTMVPLFVSVCGLTERELPKDVCPSGVLVLKVEGLAVMLVNGYPSKTVSLADTGSKKGEFENLQMFVGIGFDKLRNRFLTADFNNGGIFHFDSETNKKIEALNFRGAGNSRLQQKQLHMLGYLWELGYDLCIAPSSNISGNPGFELVLGIH